MSVGKKKHLSNESLKWTRTYNPPVILIAHRFLYLYKAENKYGKQFIVGFCFSITVLAELVSVIAQGTKFG